MGADRCCRARRVLAAALGLFTTGCSVSALAFAIVLRLRLKAMENNMVGDPEKNYMDGCLRDFEGLPVNSSVYLAQHTRCMGQLIADEGLAQWPRARPTVDERICGPSDLCAAGDPASCADQGSPRDPSYRPGEVSQCYQLIGQAKAALDTDRRALLLTQVALSCTKQNRWRGYSRRVQLEYCMWKHLSSGVCMNTMLTNCPSDGSCCPKAQNYLGAAAQQQPLRPNVYVCSKSPTVGIFCQYIDDLVPPGPASSSPGELCTAETCPSFSWCRDLADIPGFCLDEACRDYQRVRNYTIALAVVASAALLLDFADWLLLCCRGNAFTFSKAKGNVATAFLKLGAVMLCLAGGIREFGDMAARQSCFNAAGNESVKILQASTLAFLVSASLASATSCFLAPLSANQRDDSATALPYVRMHFGTH